MFTEEERLFAVPSLTVLSLEDADLELTPSLFVVDLVAEPSLKDVLRLESLLPLLTEELLLSEEREETPLPDDDKSERDPEER